MRGWLAADDRGALRILGGLLVTSGTVALLVRRTAFADAWSDLAVLLVLAALAIALFWSGFLGASSGDRPTAWQSVYLIAGIILTPLTLFQLVEWLDGDTGGPLNVTWIFAITAIAALVALYGARLRIGALLAALALIVSWVALWDELLDQGAFDEVDTLRWLLFSAAVLLLVFAGAVGASRAPVGSGSDAVTVAGLAAVVAGALYMLLPYLFIVPADDGFVSQTTLWWDLELLVSSLALIGFGAAAALNRGPAYLGAVGLAAFTFSVGLDLDDSSPAGKVLGWPAVLLALGLAALALSVLPALRRRRA
jgi:hypothetical protein